MYGQGEPALRGVVKVQLQTQLARPTSPPTFHLHTFVPPRWYPYFGYRTAMVHIALERTRQVGAGAAALHMQVASTLWAVVDAPLWVVMLRCPVTVEHAHGCIATQPMQMRRISSSMEQLEAATLALHGSSVPPQLLAQVRLVAAIVTCDSVCKLCRSCHPRLHTLLRT